MTARVEAVPRAVLDANVLLQAALRDTLLRAAEAALYVPYWGPTILAEVEHELPRLIARHTDAVQRAAHLVNQLQLAFPRALVNADLALAPMELVGLASGQIDPGDAHVVAAALAAHASVIVTENVRHFPATALASVGVVAVTADQFLLRLWKRVPQEIIAVLEEQGAALHPPRSREALLGTLFRGAPKFVAAIQSHQHPDRIQP